MFFYKVRGIRERCVSDAQCKRGTTNSICNETSGFCQCKAGSLFLWESHTCSPGKWFISLIFEINFTIVLLIIVIYIDYYIYIINICNSAKLKLDIWFIIQSIQILNFWYDFVVEAELVNIHKKIIKMISRGYLIYCILCDCIFPLSNELKRCIYLRGFPSKYNNFNEYKI